MSQANTGRRAAPKKLSNDQQDERLQDRSGLKGALQSFRDRLRSGDLGVLPVVAGLVVIWSVMYWRNDNFLSPSNLVNLTLQASDTGIIALGIVFVLLVGQIDLSVGSVSGVSAGITAILFVQKDWPLLLAIALAVFTGCFIGWVYSVMFNKFGVPSFVITLAGLLGFLGLQLLILTPYGRAVNLPFSSELVQFSTSRFLTPVQSYILVALIIVGFVMAGLNRIRERRAADLSVPSPVGLIIQAVVLAAIMIVAVSVLNQARGVSYMFLTFVALVGIMHYLLTRTRWGRSLFAVGGNPEAARRAGINVKGMYASAFVLCSGFAALGGVFAASRLSTASTSTGGGDVNLNAIAAAVIGGTSLFGGRGTAFAALLGILVIQSISNGLILLSLDSSIRFMVTGLVLLLAVTLDSLARRSRSASGVG